MDGLRVLLAALSTAQPHVVRDVAVRRKPEWNVLFPGTFPDAAPLAVIAATCSERRLHAESEQVFRVITAAAAAIVAAAAEQSLTVVFRHANRLDFPTLRAIPHLVERAGLVGARLRIVLADLKAEPASDAAAAEVATLRLRMLDALAERLGSSVEPGTRRTSLVPVLALPADSAEARWQRALDLAVSPEEVVVAALGVMRSAFFSANHDYGALAAHRLLAELDAAEHLDVAVVRSVLETSELGDDPGSLGVDASAVIDHDSLRSLAHRYLGMSYVFFLDYRRALRHLRVATGLGVPSVRAKARLLRALLLIKRIGDVAAGFEEVTAALSELAAQKSAVATVEAAWLHNVKALGHVQLRELDEAMAEERIAIRLVGKFTSTDATHLKVNLVSNVSVLREYSGRAGDAAQVWRQFSRRSQDWGDTFFKHHAYREGGLLLKAGSRDEARIALETAYRLAGAADDDFHRAHIALEFGRLLLESEPQQAAQWYDSAAAHSAQVGDPYLVALAVVGAGIARNGTQLPEADRRNALDRLEGSRSYPQPASSLAGALTSGDDAKLLACLPTPGTKLNRPFHMVRLELAPLR